MDRFQPLCASADIHCVFHVECKNFCSLGFIPVYVFQQDEDEDFMSPGDMYDDELETCKPVFQLFIFAVFLLCCLKCDFQNCFVSF